MRPSPDRRAFLALGLGLSAGACRRLPQSAPQGASDPPEPMSASTRLPVLFLGHGSPLNAIEDNRWSRALRALAPSLPRPRAVLAVSAHWTTRGSLVTANPRPETIHDFQGFPPELSAFEYPAPGDPGLARRVEALAGEDPVRASTDWGLDHGTWSVLTHLFPAADVPVVQLSLDLGRGPEEHLALAERLAPLRDEGVLVIGSGNLVHNLRDAFGRMARGDESVPAWAAAFDRTLAAALEQRDRAFLARALASADGRQAHPTAEHYLPLLYAAGMAGDEALTFPVEGFDHSLSMRSVRFG